MDRADFFIIPSNSYQHEKYISHIKRSKSLKDPVYER